MLSRFSSFFSPQVVQDVPADYSFENCPDFKNIATTFKKLCQKKDELATAAQEASGDEYLARSKFLIIDPIINAITRLVDQYHEEIDRSPNEDDKRERQMHFLESLASLLANALTEHNDTLSAPRKNYKQAAINTAIMAPSVVAGFAAAAYAGLTIGGATLFGTALARDVVMTKILKIDLQTPASVVLLEELRSESIQVKNKLYLDRLRADHETLSSHRQLI